MRLKKPYLCAECGCTDPTLFYPTNKSHCKTHYSERVLERLSDPEKYTRVRKQAAQWQTDNLTRFRWLQAKNRAKRSGIDFTITPEDIDALWISQSGLCHYTNQPMEFNQRSRFSASIDRVDSSKGYTLDNIVLCAAIVNTMKNDMSTDEFWSVVKLLGANAPK